ncbi:hypothetical protein RD792_006108 [Penstemon davidsonii]|uniref:LIM zinc-binding domain-containing protein n=1 Tax=Penstemon davidsonii TaxID=160366 RepID=A0ABR0DEL0_9LAMI|nr:hypothetical protein RD792_006108 [Penstemon davidsonii]
MIILTKWKGNNSWVSVFTGEFGKPRSIVFIWVKRKRKKKKIMSFTGTLEKCKACEKTVYPVEVLSADGISYHKSCFKCSHCKGTLMLSNYSSMEGVLYCKPHFEQLFKETGNFSKNFQSPAKSAEKLTLEPRSPSKAAGMFSGTQDKCATCGKTAYPLEKNHLSYINLRPSPTEPGRQATAPRRLETDLPPKGKQASGGSCLPTGRRLTIARALRQRLGEQLTPAARTPRRFTIARAPGLRLGDEAARPRRAIFAWATPRQLTIA